VPDRIGFDTGDATTKEFFGSCIATGKKPHDFAFGDKIQSGVTSGTDGTGQNGEILDWWISVFGCA